MSLSSEVVLNLSWNLKLGSCASKYGKQFDLATKQNYNYINGIIENFPIFITEKPTISYNLATIKHPIE